MASQPSTPQVPNQSGPGPSAKTSELESSASEWLHYQPPVLLESEAIEYRSNETDTFIYTAIDDLRRGEKLIPLFTPLSESSPGRKSVAPESSHAPTSSYSPNQELFIYTPLKDSSHEARLITLYPSDSDINAIIVCDIITVEMAAMQELDFEALSYVWGTNSSSHEIRLNGNIKLIRNNLWSALNQLRHANRPRTLWVDDLCIDQECTEERNHQVREMGQIYGSASTVLIWLGPGGEFSELAFNFIRTMIIDAELGTGGEASRSSEIEPFYKAWVLRGGMGIFWSAFKKLCLREYWERLWVIQEVGLARNIEVHCGTDYISGDIFYGVIQRAKYSWLQLRNDIEFGSLKERRGKPKKRRRRQISNREARLLDQTLFEIRNSLPNSLFRMNKAPTGKVSLRELSIGARHSVCFDPRDKVFGLFGLALDPFRAVDYSVTLFDLFQQAILTSSGAANEWCTDLLLARSLQHSFTRSLADKTVEQVRGMRDIFVLPISENSTELFSLSGKLVGSIQGLQNAWVDGQVGSPAPESPIWLQDILATTTAEVHERLQLRNDDVYGELKSVLDLVQSTPDSISYGKACPKDGKDYLGYYRHTLGRAKGQGSGCGIRLTHRMVLQDSERNVSKLKVFRIDLLSGLTNSTGEQFLVHPQGLAPESACLNDLICAIDMPSTGRNKEISDTVHVVLRWHGNRYSVVGRAFIPSHFRELRTDEEVRLQVSMLVLQLITA